jgi:hypothetical protein
MNPDECGSCGHGKINKLARKAQPKRGRGHSSYIPDPRSVDEQCQEDDEAERFGRRMKFPPNPPEDLGDFEDHVLEITGREYALSAPDDKDGHAILDYSTTSKLAGKAREENPYEHSKDSNIDYRF